MVTSLVGNSLARWTRRTRSRRHEYHKHNEVTLTVAEERELARIDADGDGIISPEEARAAAKSSAELRASNSRLWKIVFGVFALLFLSWLGNAGLMTAVIFLSKDFKVEGGSLKNKDGGSISTVNRKNVYEVTLLSNSSRRKPDGATDTSSSVVAEVTCSSVLEAISSIEQGDDGSLVKMALGNGEFWEPRMSAAYYHLHEDSFSIEQIYLDDQRDVSYDVTCKTPKAHCENAPGTLCDAVAWEDGFDDAFDGDIPSRRRRRLGDCGSKAYEGGQHYHHDRGNYYYDGGQASVLLHDCTDNTITRTKRVPAGSPTWG